MEVSLCIHDQENANGVGGTSLAGQVQPHRQKPQMPEVTAGELEELIERQGYRCALSGLMLTPDSASLDHKTPVAKGGSNKLDNLQWVEPRVNKCKHTLTNDEFLQLCKDVVCHMETIGE